jgi:hypothetical protein
MNVEKHGWFLSQVREYHYLAPFTFEPGGGAGQTPLYTYLNSQVSHP